MQVIKVCSSSLRAHMLSDATSFASMLCFCYVLLVFSSLWYGVDGRSNLDYLEAIRKQSIQNCGGKEVPKLAVYCNRGWGNNAIGKFAIHGRCLRRNDGHGQEAHSGQQAVIGLLSSSPCSLFFSIVFIHLFYIFFIFFYLALTCRVFIYLLIKFCGEISPLGEFFIWNQNTWKLWF